MDIKIAEICGLCGGCNYAINSVKKQLKQNKNVVMFKEIVHNKNVNKMLLDLGAKTKDNLNEICNDDFVIIRAHGEPKSTYKFFEENKILYEDCTCVNVKNIHKKVEEYSNNGYNIIILGKHGDMLKPMHPEIVGTIGYIKTKYEIVETEEDIKNVRNFNSKTYLVCQTTFNIQKAEKFIKIIEDIFKQKGVELVVNKSVCFAQKNINESSSILAKDRDLMVVVCGKNSSNSKELYNNLKTITNCVFLEDINLFYEEFLLLPFKVDKNTKIGITAGASTNKEESYMLKNMIQERYEN